ncbi:hypothetical protein [Patulibacter sp.]|uniref:hypothetical protein n=1 Tax=Patulibacter sp. TaxID=1912859 RepID=UPI002724884C|nr:hypothetical protein [Patulibacter sp.]MDO9410865.1 hypothetical protein [Patulibacter sp.]
MRTTDRRAVTAPAAPADVPARWSDVPPSPSDRRARRLAGQVHDGQMDRLGGHMLDHVLRVAASVPPAARTVALVHDVCERDGGTPDQVAVRLHLTAEEREALVLLTKTTGERLLDHTRRVIAAPAGPARDLALVVKRADIDDHRARAAAPDPSYDEVRELVRGALSATTAAGPGLPDGVAAAR